MSQKLKQGRSERLEKWFCDYESDHQNTLNKVTHYIGIPMIILGALSLLRKVALGPSNMALLLVLLISIFYISQDRRLGAVCTILFFIAYVISFGVSSTHAWVLFVLGWALQFVGHFAFEKRSPAFFKNLLHLLVGPLWIVGKLTRLR